MSGPYYNPKHYTPRVIAVNAILLNSAMQDACSTLARKFPKVAPFYERQRDQLADASVGLWAAFQRARA